VIGLLDPLEVIEVARGMSEKENEPLVAVHRPRLGLMEEGLGQTILLHINLFNKKSYAFSHWFL